MYLNHFLFICIALLANGAKLKPTKLGLQSSKMIVYIIVCNKNKLQIYFINEKPFFQKSIIFRVFCGKNTALSIAVIVSLKNFSVS